MNGKVSASPLLGVEDLHTTFHTDRGPVPAVDGVSLTIAAGQTLGVVGESGSGKSVLARSIMGLLPGRRVERSGRVELDGCELTALPPAALRRRWGSEIAMVFQDPMTSLSPVLRVGRQISDTMRHHLGLGRREAARAAVDLLGSVGIPDPRRRVDDYPHQLSGGMRQRVVIAIALSCKPKLLLADEPTTALDVTVQAQILDLLASQQEERRMGMMLVTHDLGVVSGRADEVAVMYAGRIVERAPAGALFAMPRHPYTEALVAATPRADDEAHAPLPVIGGRPPLPSGRPAGCAFAPRCPYATERCRVEAPTLVQAAGRAVACWHPVADPNDGPDRPGGGVRGPVSLRVPGYITDVPPPLQPRS